MSDKPMVWVTWVDSGEATHGWEPVDNDDPNDVVETFGFIVKETRAYLTISSTWDAANGHWLNQVRIWKRAIQDRREVVWCDCGD